MTDICYPADTDWSCIYSAEELATAKEDPATLALIERSEAFAWSVLASLTAYQIGTCPLTVRPCAARCAPGGSYRGSTVGGGYTGALPVATIGMLNPYISGGVWLNGCGHGDDCSCVGLSEVYLPGPVGSVVGVWVDGVEIPRSAYRVDNGSRLVRRDGEAWPSCQDMTLDDHDGFSVTYYRGARPNVMTKAAAGALAAEFLKGCEGGECRLPANVTRASRAGESYEFAPSDFSDGRTGIAEADAVIRIYNPSNLKAPPRVLSPDMGSTRVPTWSR